MTYLVQFNYKIRNNIHNPNSIATLMANAIYMQFQIQFAISKFLIPVSPNSL